MRIGRADAWHRRWSGCGKSDRERHVWPADADEGQVFWLQRRGSHEKRGATMRVVASGASSVVFRQRPPSAHVYVADLSLTRCGCTAWTGLASQAREEADRSAATPAPSTRSRTALSGGQRQRVAIARAVHRPRRDHRGRATSALDVGARWSQTCSRTLKRDLGLAMVFVSDRAIRL